MGEGGGGAGKEYIIRYIRANPIRGWVPQLRKGSELRDGSL